MMDFLFGGLFIYSAYFHYKYFKSPERTGRSEIKRMALTIMIATGIYGGYLIFKAMGN